MDAFAAMIVGVVILAVIASLASSFVLIKSTDALPENTTIGNQIGNYSLSCTQPNISLSCPDVTINYSDAPLIVLDVWAAKKAHKYQRGNESETPYVCRHYARDLFDLLEGQGFNPQVCWTKTHAWVQVGEMVLDLTAVNPFVNPEDWKYYDGQCSFGGPPEWWYE